jgi:hypothetical protein
VLVGTYISSWSWVGLIVVLCRAEGECASRSISSWSWIGIIIVLGRAEGECAIEVL